MEFWEEVLNEMTAEVRAQVKADLEKRFPYVEFKSYYQNASDGIHVDTPSAPHIRFKIPAVFRIRNPEG